MGIVGYGMMGRLHAYAMRAAPLIRDAPVHFAPVVMSGRDATALERAATACHIDEWSLDWRALVEREDVDVVDICTPPGAHAEIAIAAANQGKDVICEKTMANDAAEAREMRAAAQAAAQAVSSRST